MTSDEGLRQRKKAATRKALREAALRLALRHGLQDLRVDDIADAAGVSPRTYNNYFSSREQAVVAAITAEREAQLASALAGRAGGGRLADVVRDVVVTQFTDPGGRSRDALLMLTTEPALRDAFLDATVTIEHPLAAVIADRIGDTDGHTAYVLAGSVAAAIRFALQRWLRDVAETSTGKGLVFARGSLEELLKASLAPLEPALDAADHDTSSRTAGTERASPNPPPQVER